mgnify:CR=1 FL=1
MSHDLSRLFSGGSRAKPVFEFKSAKKGPFTGKRLAIASSADHAGNQSAEGLGNFAARNGILRRDENALDKQLAEQV